MLSTFLDKASGLLDRRFLVAYWFSTLIAGMMVLLVGVMPYGFINTWEWCQQQDAATRVGLALGGLVLVTLIAYLLQAFARPLVRLYEGYWPHWLRRLSRRMIEKRWQRWKRERSQAAESDLERYAILQDRLHYEYPTNAAHLLPTRLGNVIRSAEDYPVTAYGMDIVFWWPRLMYLLPEAVQQSVEDALTPLFALLNLTTLVSVMGLGGAFYLWQSQLGGWCGPVIFLIGGLLLARICYLGAVAQARGYGQQIRASVDLYRFDLLKALHQGLPPTPKEERALWRRLSAWLYSQDRGVVQRLTFDHGAKAMRKSLPQESNKTGLWASLRRLLQGN